MNAALSIAQSSTYRNRLIFRSWHRGTQESDLLLGSFADSCLARLDNNQLQRFETLLDCSDPDLFEWILGGGVPPAQHDHDVLHLLRAYWAQPHDTPLERLPTASATRGE
jgi:antitoxin CptB